MDGKKGGIKWSYIFLLIVLALIIALVFIDTGNSGELIDVSQVVEYIDGEKVEEIFFKDNVGKIKLKSEFEPKTIEDFPKNSHYYVVCTEQSLEIVVDTLKKYNDTHHGDLIKYNFEASYPIGDILFPILFLGFGAFAIFLVYKLLSSNNKNAISFGRSNAKPSIGIKVRFSDIAGADEEKLELEEIVEFLRSPEKFIALGARIPKGILLVGPPGTGKTLLARAVAGESNVPFLSISGSDFVEMFVGVGASRVRDLFMQAKKSRPCIVFIDEIDAVGRQRGAGLGGGNDEREQTLNQLLVEMDGFESNDGIIVLAATNRNDVLDPALLRPGRFDRQVHVHMPDVRGREGILKIHARNKPIAEDIEFKTLARITSGFTGADLENMLNEAAILAARNNRPRILMTDITEGINKVVMGPQKRSRLVTENDRKISAYHEAGHAVLAKLLKHTDEVQEVSIIPRGDAAGYTMSRPLNDDDHFTYNKIVDIIAMTMGGRIAEEIIFQDISTGAVGDIKQATRLARRMVTEWGMSKKLGFMDFANSEAVFIGRDYQVKNNFSEKISAEIDDEVRSILDLNYKRAKEILIKNLSFVHEMVKLLLEKETIYLPEIELIMNKKKAKDIIKEMELKEKDRLKKEDEERKEFERQKLVNEYKKKIETGAMFEQNGIISQEEFRKLKDECATVLQNVQKEREVFKKTMAATPKVKRKKAEEINEATQSKVKKTQKKISKDEGEES